MGRGRTDPAESIGGIGRVNMESVIKTTSGNHPVIRIKCENSPKEAWDAQEAAQRIHSLAGVLYRELDFYADKLEAEGDPNFIENAMSMLQSFWEADFQESVSDDSSERRIEGKGAGAVMGAGGCMERNEKKSIELYLKRKRELLAKVLDPEELEALTDDDLFDQDEYDLPQYEKEEDEK